MSWPYWARNQRARVVAPPPPPVPGTFTPNLPAGYVPLVDLTFDDTFPSEPITTAAFLVYKGASISRFIPDRAQAIAGAGESGQYALRLKHLAGTGATYAGQVDLASVNVPANMRKAYIAWAFRLAPDFQFEVSGHKILYPKYVDNFTGHGQSPMLNLRFVGEDSFSDFWRWDVQQMYRWNGSGWTSVSNQNVGPTVNFQVNVDYRFEVQMEMETPGLGNGPADGIFRMWYSTWTGSGWSAPVLYMEYTNVRYANQTATFNRWNSLKFDVYRGGGGSPTLAADASMFFSRIYWGHQP